MDTIVFYLNQYEFHRSRFAGLLDRILEDGNVAALGWRPGSGRAHLAWQFMHVAITEELFATERLNPEMSRLYENIWSRFRSGSVPDDDIPDAEAIRETMRMTRQSLVETVTHLDRDRLDEIPSGLKERGWSYRDALRIIAWHEAHHHGQAHITYNLYKALQQ